MDDVRVLEAAYYMDYRVALTDICEELVTKSLTFARALDESRNINKFDDCRDSLFTVIHLGKLLNPLIRDIYYSDVRINCRKRIVRRKRTSLCK